jgi:fermentation-respiration switch protein FrsA (DUF1100 family)
MPVRQRVTGIVTTALVAYTVFVGALFLLQRQMMYHPDQQLPSVVESGVPDMKAVTTTTEDGLDLVSWYQAAEPGQPTLVLFHGNAGNIGDRAFKARPFLRAGYGVLLSGYRGYGGNPGSPSEDGLYADARSVLNFLGTSGVPPEKWVLYGESLGSGVAVEMAREWAGKMPVRAVVLEAPFTSMGDAAAAHYPFIPARWLVRDRYNSVDKISGIKAPLLIIHGDKDGTVPTKLGRRLFEAASGPKQAHWIAGAGHNNLYEFGVETLVREFIDALARE